MTQHRGPGFPGARHAVFVQTDNLAANQVVAYHRGADGTLSQAGTYSTGGAGGQLSGSVVDHLASQGSLNYDASRALLIAVNAGSNTVSVFSVSGDRLARRQVIGSGGTFPVSVASRGDLGYVANAENGGTVQGYRVFGGRLVPIPGSNRSLGAEPVGDAAVHQHAGPGGLLAERIAARRDDQGQRQQHRPRSTRSPPARPPPAGSRPPARTCSRPTRARRMSAATPTAPPER